MVSVFEGQLTRTWFYQIQNRKHVVNLYHDTITGVRSAMLDFQEIKGSLGNSSFLMDSMGHRIFLTVENNPGYIEIKNAFWSGFSYKLVINDKEIPEATEVVATDQDKQIFRPKIIGCSLTQDELSEYQVCWYEIQTTRLTDGAETCVHRRFKEFADLNSQIKQNLKGNHLRWAIPPLPDKPLKQMTDHRDPAFIEDRRAKLDVYIQAMVAVPHVANMVCVKAFLGVMDMVREFSVCFHVPTLGMSLDPSSKLADSTPAVVKDVQKKDVCKGVRVGDSISKINGVAVGGYSYQAVIQRIKSLPRPMIIHFIQVLPVEGSVDEDYAEAKALGENKQQQQQRRKEEEEEQKRQQQQQQAGAQKAVAQKALPTFDGDNDDGEVVLTKRSAPPAAPAAVVKSAAALTHPKPVKESHVSADVASSPAVVATSTAATATATATLEEVAQESVDVALSATSGDKQQDEEEQQQDDAAVSAGVDAVAAVADNGSSLPTPEPASTAVDAQDASPPASSTAETITTTKASPDAALSSPLPLGWD